MNVLKAEERIARFFVLFTVINIRMRRFILYYTIVSRTEFFPSSKIKKRTLKAFTSIHSIYFYIRSTIQCIHENLN